MRRKSFTKDGSGSSASRSDNTAGAWIEQYDEQAGSSYYSNSVTGATSWTRPTEMDNLSLSSASATGDHNQIHPFRLQLVLHACEKC
jgi:tRNA G37 N-methylase TrmD